MSIQLEQYDALIAHDVPSRESTVSARVGAAEPLSYSMTSSARASSVGGTSSAFAVFRLITEGLGRATRQDALLLLFHHRFSSRH